MSNRTVVYTRVNCPLCDEAKEMLERYGLSLTLIDVDQDAELKERFDTCVPVVEIDGQIRFRGRINEVLLRRILVSE